MKTALGASQPAPMRSPQQGSQPPLYSQQGSSSSQGWSQQQWGQQSLNGSQAQASQQAPPAQGSPLKRKADASPDGGAAAELASPPKAPRPSAAFASPLSASMAARTAQAAAGGELATSAGAASVTGSSSSMAAEGAPPAGSQLGAPQLAQLPPVVQVCTASSCCPACGGVCMHPLVSRDGIGGIQLGGRLPASALLNLGPCHVQTVFLDRLYGVLCRHFDPNVSLQRGRRPACMSSMQCCQLAMCLLATRHRRLHATSVSLAPGALAWLVSQRNMLTCLAQLCPLDLLCTDAIVLLYLLRSCTARCRIACGGTAPWTIRTRSALQQRPLRSACARWAGGLPNQAGSDSPFLRSPAANRPGDRAAAPSSAAAPALDRAAQGQGLAARGLWTHRGGAGVACRLASTTVCGSFFRCCWRRLPAGPRGQLAF